MELFEIKGISKRRTTMLNNAGIFSVFDLLNYFPYKYYDFSNIETFDTNNTSSMVVKGKIVVEAKSVYAYKLSYVIAKVKDSQSDNVFSAVWYNQSFIKNALNLNEEYIFWGKANSKRQLVVQKFISINELSSPIVPVYRQIAGLGSKIISNSIKQILDKADLNKMLLDHEAELSLNEAYKKIHFPENITDIELGKKRISLEDMVVLASSQVLSESNFEPKTQKYDTAFVEEFFSISPFKPTNDQKQAIFEIANDLTDSMPMNRLLLGDVGSGKTLVAFAMCFIAAKSGNQAVIVAPTEILARQHYNSLIKLLNNQSINVCLLHSKLNASDRNILQKNIKDGTFKIIIGTHSVFSDKIEFLNLSAIITDEQHRFGVSQRAKLSQKSSKPDVLIMSATPIPRSLSLVFFGNLKTSKLIERPMGESKVSTHLLGYNKLNDFHEYLKKQIIEKNLNCFIVVPRIEDTETSELFSTEQLSKIFDSSEFFKDKYKIIHGKQEQFQQEEIVNAFRKLEFPILIATTIIEVGIDIPTASIMVIHNADRFGFATLHQLRGRIGRNGSSAQCFCITDTSSENAIKRLTFFKKHNNGFEIAEEDFKTRGSGTIIGTKQHGYSEIISKYNFSIDELKKAEIIVRKLPKERIMKLKTEFENRFGELFKKIVMN